MGILNDEESSAASDSYDVLAALEEWRNKEKCRSVQIDIDDGYGATCWRVELRRGEKAVYCSETNFILQEGVEAGWHEHDGNLYCCVVKGDSMDGWPGLEATIRRAIECAVKFFPS